MKTVTTSDLARASGTELRVLAGIFNSLLVSTEPLSAEWQAAANAVDAIAAERNRRLAMPFRLAG